MDVKAKNQDNGSDQAVMEPTMEEEKEEQYMGGSQPEDVEMEITNNNAEKKTPFEKEREQKSSLKNEQTKAPVEEMEENMSADVEISDTEEVLIEKVEKSKKSSAKKRSRKYTKPNKQEQSKTDITPSKTESGNKPKINPLTYLMLPGQLFVVVASNLLLSAYSRRKEREQQQEVDDFDL